MKKMFFACALFLSCQSMAWHLTSETNTNAQELHCAQDIEIQMSADKSTLSLLTANDHQVWQEIDDIDQGRQCHSHASYSPLGGYGCVEAWSSKGTYTNSYCGSDVGFWKCSPKLHHDERESISVAQDQVSYSYDNTVMTGGAVHFKCVYR